VGNFSEQLWGDSPERRQHAAPHEFEVSDGVDIPNEIRERIIAAQTEAMRHSGGPLRVLAGATLRREAVRA